MKTLTILAVSAMAAVSLLGADLADARRLGGGRSLGMQRQVTPPAAAPAPAPTTPGAASNPVMPANPATAAARPAAPGAAAAAPSGASRWLGPIAGIAAGLGLAALMAHLGLSETFASLLLIALLVVGVVFVARLFLVRRASPQPALPGASYRSPNAAMPGNDGRARFEPTWGGGSAASTPATGRAFPPGFDPAPFVQQARLQFRKLQEAYDKGDRQTLADVMTPQLFAEIARDLDQRGTQAPTDVVALDADVIDVVQEGRNYVASVRFTGSLREDGAAEAKPFVEIWNLVKPVDGKSGWMLAGIQQGEESLAAH
jgi:predicted lipid-binding transport protein (Tim44 family)